MFCSCLSLPWLVIETYCSKSSNYRNIFYRNIVCEKVVCDVGLKMDQILFSIKLFNSCRVEGVLWNFRIEIFEKIFD
jgi:hypothetical protein